MVKRLFVILLMGITTFLLAQTIAPKKCNTCGKPLAQCQYKGRHPDPAAEEAKRKEEQRVRERRLAEQRAKEEAERQRLAEQRAREEAERQRLATTGTHRGHEWVDLGLPSGTKWATMNVGATSPSDYGNYYAWGETSPKSSYTWGNLRYRISGDSYNNVNFSKYVTDSKYGNVDGKKELELSDDAAHANWGSGWRMPSKAQQDELREKCKWKWFSQGGHTGYKVVGPNGNSLFLPAAGFWSGSYSSSFGSYGVYWSRTLSTSNGYNAYYLYFSSGGEDWTSNFRYYGRSVRAVRSSE